MHQRPIFNSEAQAIEALFRMLQQLAALTAWIVIAILHLALAMAAILACWLGELSVSQIAAAAQQAYQTSTVQALSFAGVSGASLMAGWVWAVRKAHAKIAMPLLTDFLLKDL